MALVIADKWIWDFWFAKDGRDYHIFYLQALKSLGMEFLRHRNVSIGHAISQDLVSWEVLPDALYPSSQVDDGWDSYTTWTGSIIKHEQRWYMLYTGGRWSEDALVQRIGLAWSHDLIHWQKHAGNPVLSADPNWYELLDLDSWHDQAWRDPYVFFLQETQLFHAFFTARVNYGPADGRGVIGHASSADLINWRVFPPVTAPGNFGHMEVPQLVALDGRYYLLFSTDVDALSTAWIERHAGATATGTYYLVSSNPLGPFEMLEERLLVGDVGGRFYSGKIIRNPQDEPVFIAFHNMNSTGEFVGEVIDPLPVIVQPDGRLTVSG